DALWAGTETNSKRCSRCFWRGPCSTADRLAPSCYSLRPFRERHAKATGMKEPRQEFQAIDQTRTGSIEIGRSFDGIDLTVAHSWKVLPTRARGEPIKF